MQKPSLLPLKPAVNYIASRVADVDKSLIQSILTTNPELLEAKTMEQLLNILVTKFSWTLVGDEDSSDENSGQEESVEDQLAALLKQVDLELSKETLTYLANHFLFIQKQMSQGVTCIRWILLNQRQQVEVTERLLGGLATVIFYLASNIGIEKKHIVGGDQILIEQFKQRTIIIHGSYLFGPGKYVPADMDVIDTGTTSERAPLIKLVRETKEGFMTLGKRFSLIDVMVGIPLSIHDEDTLLGKKLAALWQAVAENLKEYLGDARKEKDEGKRYRKLVNIAIILNYFAEKLQIKVEATLLQNIQKANESIVGSNPQKLGQLNEILQDQCNKLYNEVSKI